MPRLPVSLLRKARAIDALLPPLLAPCRDLGAAQNELRWLREHVQDNAKARSTKEKAALLKRLVRHRATGKPLQYILGTEYFGDLEIQCRPGVLIPRHETAASVTHLVQLLCQTNELPSELRVLDLCTGTGCIPLLFQHEFSKRQDVQLELLGLDISRKAIDLARHNRDRVLREEKYAQACSIDFRRADVLLDPFGNQTDGPMCVMAALNFYRKRSFWDILISNPPYISPSEYWKTTQRSVRGFEPALALVPPATGGISDLEQGHRFYPRLLQIVRDVEAKIVLFEVADLDQALRVAQMAREMRVFDGIEIWRDQPDQDAQSEQANFPIVGAGNGRSVFCWRGPGGSWLMKTPTERSVIPHDRIG